MIKHIIVIFTVLTVLLVPHFATAGDVRSPRSWYGTLKPREGIDHKLVLRGKENTSIEVRGDGNGDIDCTLKDETGHVVDEDRDNFDRCSMRVVPIRTGDYSLTVVNNGKNPSVVRMDTN